MFAVDRLLNTEDEEIDLEDTDGDDSDYNASEDSDSEAAALVEISQLEGIEFCRGGNRSQKLVVTKNQTGSAFLFTDAETDRIDLPPGSTHVLAHPPGHPTKLEWCTLEALKKGAESVTECLQDPQKTLCLKPMSVAQWQRVCKERVAACPDAKWSKGVWSALVHATTHKSNDELIAKHPTVTKCLPEPYVGWSHCKPTNRKAAKPTATKEPAKPQPTPAQTAKRKAPADEPPEPATPKKAKPQPVVPKPEPKASVPAPAKPAEATQTSAPKTASGSTQYTLTVTSTNVKLLETLAKNLAATASTESA